MILSALIRNEEMTREIQQQVDWHWHWHCKSGGEGCKPGGEVGGEGEGRGGSRILQRLKLVQHRK